MRLCLLHRIQYLHIIRRAFAPFDLRRWLAVVPLSEASQSSSGSEARYTGECLERPANGVIVLSRYWPGWTGPSVLFSSSYFHVRV